MEKRKRACIIKRRIFVSMQTGAKAPMNEEFKAVFHQWGDEVFENQDGSFISGTVGIVESENGKIHTVNPEHITFTDK